MDRVDADYYATFKISKRVGGFLAPGVIGIFCLHDLFTFLASAVVQLKEFFGVHEGKKELRVIGPGSVYSPTMIENETSILILMLVSIFVIWATAKLLDI